MVIVVMGVSGSGKSTIGKLLAQKMAIPFYDADDFHPQVNIDKMNAGLALNDTDRAPWLEILADKIAPWNKAKGAVLACSALKDTYRHILGEDNIYVYLKGSIELISQRLQKRHNHFMPPTLLQSQFQALEEPINAIIVSIDDTIENIVNSILEEIEKNGY